MNKCLVLLLLTLLDLDLTRFYRHISSSSDRTFVTVGKWPKLVIHEILVSARYRCKAGINIRPQ